MVKQQRTIKSPISISGIGLHTGDPCSLTFHPAPVGHGIQFKRLDIANSVPIPANIDYVVDISRGTILGHDDIRIHTVEHVLSALAGMEVDNVLIELTSSEPPVLDGSSLPFVKILKKAVFEEQEAPKEYLELDQTISYHDGEKVLTWL
jgi:UDP-3-O-[3-hydroxymyristoyl] N-acetylglucosamine deacetylase/3-hydroxyacyl-[acyl-carrier-protein] dehydratase